MNDSNMSDLRSIFGPLNEAADAIITRCRSIGLVVLCVDSERTNFSASGEPMQKILESSIWKDALNGSANTWQSPFELDRGIEVIPIPLSDRGRPQGTILAHRFTRDAEHSALVHRAAQAAQNPEGLASIIANAAHPDRTDTRALFDTLNWIAQDQISINELDNDIDDLANRLSESYETLDVLYSLGRAMRDIEHPDRFIEHVCERLRETLGFGFVAVHVDNDDRILEKRTTWLGTTEAGPESYEQRDRLLEAINANAPLSEWKDSFGTVIRPLPVEYGTNALIVAGNKISDGGHISSYDTKLIDASSSITATFLSNARLYDQQRQLFLGVIESLSAAVDAKDTYTQGHSLRVAYIAEMIALNLGMNRDEAKRVHIAGVLHDVGKIGIPEAVLQKTGRLTDDEYDEIKKHPEIGYHILKDLSGLEDILPGVLHHHERIDGRGYPHGLAGDDIPFIARILACADTFDAMSSTRSYRAAMPRDRVISEINQCAGTQLDASVVDAFMNIELAEYDRMVTERRGYDSTAA